MLNGGVSPASPQGPQYLDSAISAGLITLLHSHHFPRRSAPPHAPDTKSYVTAYLGSHIALRVGGQKVLLLLPDRAGKSGGEGGERGFFFVEISHFPQTDWHLSLFLQGGTEEAQQHHRLFKNDSL